MLKKVLTAVASENKKTKGTALAVGGMAALLTGQKVAPLMMFAKGFQLIEQAWRDEHPEFNGTLKDRVAKSLEFYEATHADGMNRRLHMLGIPLILGGAAGLLTTPGFSPPWVASAGMFVGGWALNIVGHSVYEKNKPAFTDDPLSFLMGPVWDVKQLLGHRKSEADVA